MIYTKRDLHNRTRLKRNCSLRRNPSSVSRLTRLLLGCKAQNAPTIMHSQYVNEIADLDFCALDTEFGAIDSRDSASQEARAEPTSPSSN